MGKKSQKNVDLSRIKSQHSEKMSKTCAFKWQNITTSVKKSQKC